MNTNSFILLKNLLITSSIASIFSSVLIQKIKKIINLNKSMNMVESMIISLIFGFYFSSIFTNYELKYDIFVGIITFSGADIIYKKFKDSNFSSSFIEKEDKNATKKI